MAAGRSFSSPEAALLLVSTKNRDLWPGPTQEVRDFPSLCACLESSLTNLIGSGLNLLCLQSYSKPECHRTWAEVAILGADQKERSLWGRECGRWVRSDRGIACNRQTETLALVVCSHHKHPIDLGRINPWASPQSSVFHGLCFSRSIVLATSLLAVEG